MAALQGLSGLYPDPQDTSDTMDEGVLEAKAFTPDADHGQYGSQSIGYSGSVPDASPFSGMPVYDGWNGAYANDFVEQAGSYSAPGTVGDTTPDSHCAPYPRGILQGGYSSASTPGGLEVVNEQMTQLHQRDMGGPAFFNGNSMTGHEEETHYTTDDYDAPNENYLSSDVPGQLRGNGGHGASGASGLGGGNADPTQGYGVLNTLPEFQMGHSIRRVQHDTTVFDYTGTHGEQDVPFYGRHPIQQMPLDGPDSPYFESGNIDGANIVWEGRIGPPSEYVQPPEPEIVTSVSSPDVFAWG